jgi:Protein of unknown function (DUF3592)
MGLWGFLMSRRCRRGYPVAPGSAARGPIISGVPMKTVRILLIAFFCVGISLLLAAALVYEGTAKFVGRSRTAKGTVMELREERSISRERTSRTLYFPVVQFRAEGGAVIEFRSNFGSNPPAHRKGEIVPIRYDPVDPQGARIDTPAAIWFVTWILVGLGVVFTGVPLVFFALRRQRVRREETLRETGQLVTTRIQSVVQYRNYRMGTRHPWLIVTQWVNPTDGKVYTFRSRNIPYDPTPFVQGKEIHVRVDLANPKRYLMDTSFLPGDVM